VDAALGAKEPQRHGRKQVIAQVLHELSRLLKIVDCIVATAVRAPDKARYVRWFHKVQQPRHALYIVNAHTGIHELVLTAALQEVPELAANPAVCSNYNDFHSSDDA
jgi:hypothetical protein